MIALMVVLLTFMESRCYTRELILEFKNKIMFYCFKELKYQKVSLQGFDIRYKMFQFNQLEGISVD